MNRRPLLASSLVILFAAAITVPVHAQRAFGLRGGNTQRTNAMIGLPDAGSYVHPIWLIRFQPVPVLLCMHCPLLKPDQGLVVSKVFKHGPSAQFYDIRAGDILLSVGGEDVTGMANLPAAPGADLAVMRAGKEFVLTSRVDLASVPPQGPWQGFQNGMFTRAGPRGVSASSFATGNESVSVAQNGRQYSIKMSLPDLQSAPINLTGTRQQILDQLSNGKYSAAVKQRVIDSMQ